MIHTPRSYWLALALGALVGLVYANLREKSAMASAISTPPAALIEMASKVVERGAGGDPESQCALLHDARAELGARELELGTTPECKAYRDFRDFRGPRGAVFALYGSLVGLFVGMFVNKKLRESGKYAYWTD